MIETAVAESRGTSSFDIGDGRTGRYHRLKSLDQNNEGRIARLPRSIVVLLEAVLRAARQGKVPQEHVALLADWQPNAKRTKEIGFVVNRILLPDSTGVPLLVDLVAMRSAAERLGHDPGLVEPLVPIDLVIDHSIQIDHAGKPGSLDKNMAIEFARNRERFEFIKWGSKAFKNFNVTPPGVGICHQVNLERLAKVVWTEGDLHHFDVMLGADSHTSMVNGLGVLAWGVGGIEAEAAMLGQPSYMLVPDVVGVELTGVLPEGTTSTDLVLAVTERLRKARVVGKFVEFFGDGAARLSVPERATLANMAPEYGATVGYFPIDDQTLAYLRMTGRPEGHVLACEAFLKVQGAFGMPRRGECDYSETIVIDLAEIRPSVAGPKRPQDRIELAALGETFRELIRRPSAEGGYGKESRRSATGKDSALQDGDVVLAAITSCTNTSNPLVMIAAGLLARNARACGLAVAPHIKTSLAPGSHVVTDYLDRLGLLAPLEDLGFNVVAYGCGSCLGNSGPLEAALEQQIVEQDIISAAVLSGNRNFEARVHPAIRANFLASPPLVVAFAIAGRATIDFENEPIGIGLDGESVFLRDIWPATDEIADLANTIASDTAAVNRVYGTAGAGARLWDELPVRDGRTYDWPSSTYVKEPPFFATAGQAPAALEPIEGARALAIFGDSITTDHISPAGSIKPSSPAGLWLVAEGVAPQDFNSFAARRSNHLVMMRGTFGNSRIVNRMAGGEVGPLTRHMPSGDGMTIFDAAMRYAEERTPLLVFAGEEYGTGSSRDWAAKGPRLLGVRAVIARSFERIHRGNLVGMGILPLQFLEGDSLETLGIDGSETFDLALDPRGVRPSATVGLTIHRADCSSREVRLLARIDTPMEVEYFRNGGVLPFVLRQLCGTHDTTQGT